MRNFWMGSTLPALVVLAVLPLLAQSPSRPQPGAARSAVAQGGPSTPLGTVSDKSNREQGRTAKAIPDLSGTWVAPLGLPRSPCGEPACLALQGVSLPERFGKIVQTMEEPQMLPWTEEQYKVAREGVQDLNDFGRDQVNPWITGCAPPGPAWIMLNPFEAFELRQFPDVVLLLSEDDHAVRRIYLDGKHPTDWKLSPMGHSTGRYDGDTLVVDTVGINDKTWIDLQGHPHSDALHLVERIRRVGEKSLETEVTIDDPKAYKKPWTKKIVRQLVPTRPGLGEDALCDELLKMGTHYGAETKK